MQLLEEPSIKLSGIFFFFAWRGIHKGFLRIRQEAISASSFPCLSKSLSIIVSCEPNYSYRREKGNIGFDKGLRLRLFCFWITFGWKQKCTLPSSSARRSKEERMKNKKLLQERSVVSEFNSPWPHRSLLWGCSFFHFNHRSKINILFLGFRETRIVD